MYHQIDTPIQRTHIQRGGEGGIHQRLDLVALGDVGKTLQIQHTEVRVGRRFRDQQACVVLDGSFQGIVIADVHDRAADP